MKLASVRRILAEEGLLPHTRIASETGEVHGIPIFRGEDPIRCSPEMAPVLKFLLVDNDGDAGRKSINHPDYSVGLTGATLKLDFPTPKGEAFLKKSLALFKKGGFKLTESPSPKGSVWEGVNRTADKLVLKVEDVRGKTLRLTFNLKLKKMLTQGPAAGDSAPGTWQSPGRDEDPSTLETSLGKYVYIPKEKRLDFYADGKWQKTWFAGGSRSKATGIVKQHEKNPDALPGEDRYTGPSTGGFF